MCMLYGNLIQMNVVIMISICACQCRPMYTHLPEIAIDIKMIYREYFMNKVSKRVILYNFFSLGVSYMVNIYKHMEL